MKTRGKTQAAHDGGSFADIDMSLCSFCGTCIGVCPVGALSMGKETVELTGECVSCGLCVRACPGIGVSFRRLSRKYLDGPGGGKLGFYRSAYVSRAADEKTRSGGSSGGFVTAILRYLFEEGIVKKALLVGMERERPWHYEARIATSADEAAECAGSKYSIVPLNVLIKELRKSPERSVVVGLPCHIHAIRKLQDAGWFGSTDGPILISLFCGFNMSIDATGYLIKKLGLGKDEITGLSYRKGRWPGGFFAETASGEKKSLPKDAYDILNPLFLHRRCSVCPDLTGELSDISAGDAWLSGYEGFSSVIVRTRRGESAFNGALGKGHVKAEKIDGSVIEKTHSHLLRYKKAGIRLRFWNPKPAFDVPPEKLSIPGFFKEMLVLAAIRAGRNKASRRAILLMPIGAILLLSSLAKAVMKK